MLIIADDSLPGKNPRPNPKILAPPLKTMFTLPVPVKLTLAGLLLAVAGVLAFPATPPGSRAQTVYPVCRQSSLLPAPAQILDAPPASHKIYLPLLLKAPEPPPCTVYCGLLPQYDPYRPAGYQLYFADEFDCNQLLDYWTVQGPMTAASYQPPASGIVAVADGSLRLTVPGAEPSFPYLYLADDSATSYDVPHTARRVDWLPNSGDFRLAMRLRFQVEALGEHRVAVYADGHRPEYAGPLFYIGSDFNAEQEAWRGLIAGADRGHSFADLGEQGYPDPFTDWLVLTVDFLPSADAFVLAVDGAPRISKPLSSFKGYPAAATRPDILYLGSLAMLQKATRWTDIELDWLRVYAPAGLPAARYGLLEAVIEPAPVPTDSATLYSAALPPGPFANTPHWSEDFDGSVMPPYWTQVANPDPGASWTAVDGSAAQLLNNGWAAGVPVWAIFDDMLSPEVLEVEPDGPRRESPVEYLRRRGGSPLLPDDPLGAAAEFPRTDWRPDGGNIRYAWRGFQSAKGYGVEISNAGHGDWGGSVYFTGAMFYTLLDITTPDGGQFIFPGCQEQYFWRLHRLPQYGIRDTWTIVTADYINGTVHLYVDGQKIGWWPESDCSLNWYLQGENATSPEVLFFGNPATARDNPGGWSEVHVDWFATFPGLPR
ncbi:MAG: hypothetical protein Kow0031_07790 [Anaerolineae bacterium]